jgi:hypothetical protein
MWAAWAGVGLVVVQMVFFSVSPPPGTTEDYFELLVDNPVLGMLSLDLLYVLGNLAAYLVYLALVVVLWQVNRSAMTVGLALGTLGMAAYMAAPRFVEMLTLARAYHVADGVERVALLAMGDGMIAGSEGSAFDIYYVLNGIALLIFAVVILRSTVLSRATGTWALVAAALMSVPSNAGEVGLVFAIASLVPWAVFSVLLARRLDTLSRPEQVATAG